MNEIKNLLQFKSIDGVDQSFEIDVNATLTMVYASGETKEIVLTKAAPRNRVALEDMTIDELRVEFRNAQSVYYKNNKKHDELVKLATPVTAVEAVEATETVAAVVAVEAFVPTAEAIATLAKFDAVKLAEQKKRAEDAKALFETKFVGQAIAVGSTGTTKSATPKNTKADAIQAIIDTVAGSALPEEQKKESLDKLNALLAALTKPKKEKVETVAAPAAEAEVVATTEVTEPVVETIPEEAKPAGRRNR
jgi:hypothetical protein